VQLQLHPNWNRLPLKQNQHYSLINLSNQGLFKGFNLLHLFLVSGFSDIYEETHCILFRRYLSDDVHVDLSYSTDLQLQCQTITGIITDEQILF
jgi:hypothetical protein